VPPSINPVIDFRRLIYIQLPAFIQVRGNLGAISGAARTRASGISDHSGEPPLRKTRRSSLLKLNM
jgi:cation transporter-like permease